MKLRNKIAAITAAAMLAFTGVGFAAWTFTQEVTTNVEVSSVVTCAIEAKDVKVYREAAKTNEVTDLFLVLDAPSGVAGIEAGLGAYWAYEDNGNYITLTDVYLAGDIHKADYDIVNGTTVTGQFTIDASSLNSAVSTYLTIDAMPSVANVTKNYSEVSDGNYDFVSAAVTLPSIAYVNANLPTNVDEVATWKAAINTAIGNNKINVAFATISTAE